MCSTLSELQSELQAKDDRIKALEDGLKKAEAPHIYACPQSNSCIAECTCGLEKLLKGDINETNS